MECANCHTILATAKQLFFYEKNDGIHLSFRPECRSSLPSTMLLKERDKKKKRKKGRKVACKACGNGIGTDLPFGPGNTSFIAFARDSVMLFGENSPRKKQSWREMTYYSRIEARRDINFFGGKTAQTLGVLDPCPRDSQPNKPVAFASKLEDFSWHNLVKNIRPRAYQVEAFVEALSRNLVVVIPTGAGKTLVAALLLARMARLNPGHMGLFVAESVPLVYQQAKAVHLRTGLRVLPLCGQSKTAGTLRDLRDGAYDVLVITGNQPSV